MNPVNHIYKRLFAFYGPQHWWPAKTGFEMIIGAILTQNTSWKNVEKSIGELKKNGLLDFSSLSRVKLSRLSSAIRSSGYYNVKAKRIKNFLSFLSEEYGGSLKKMFARETAVLRTQLLAVKGLGPETVDCILLYGGKRPVFVVDAYTRRIFSRHWFIRDNDSYQAVQEFFHSHLDKDTKLFNEYHALIVALGKNICRKNPQCSICPLRALF